jgi:hypothetical protein
LLKLPVPDVLQRVVAVLVAEALSNTGLLAQMVWAEPASIVGAGFIVMTMASEAVLAAHVALP